MSLVLGPTSPSFSSSFTLDLSDADAAEAANAVDGSAGAGDLTAAQTIAARPIEASESSGERESERFNFNKVS